MMAPSLLFAATIAALAGSAPPKRPNMPAGWTWPPSAAMKAAEQQCKERLDAAEVAWKPGAAAKKIAAPVVVPTMTLGAVVLHPLRAAKSHPMDCQLAAGITEVSAALAELGVAKIRFRSLHEYRFVKKRGRTTKILSRHALGLAIDVYGFELTDGRIIEVERDWATEPLLATIAGVFAASPRFRTPLTPANDPDGHDDHVHLEAHMRISSADSDQRGAAPP